MILIGKDRSRPARQRAGVAPVPPAQHADAPVQVGGLASADEPVVVYVGGASAAAESVQASGTKHYGRDRGVSERGEEQSDQLVEAVQGERVIRTAPEQCA